jgi:hypothetical protein
MGEGPQLRQRVGKRTGQRPAQENKEAGLLRTLDVSITNMLHDENGDTEDARTQRKATWAACGYASSAYLRVITS